ncbi:MAG TPA: hypothetical protein VGN49_11630 [Micrococcaceae bacterium]|jgi:hypothetical protein|nr:hypothetical protein [Micrococcaceae bacterium]
MIMNGEYYPFRELDLTELRSMSLTHELVPSIATGGSSGRVSFWTVLAELAPPRFEELSESRY